jgi:hypothetical protein
MPKTVQIADEARGPPSLDREALRLDLRGLRRDSHRAPPAVHVQGELRVGVAELPLHPLRVEAALTTQTRVGRPKGMEGLAPPAALAHLRQPCRVDRVLHESREVAAVQTRL